MNYQEYLQRFQYPDSPWAQQEYRREFGGSDPEFSFALGDRIGGRSSPGKVWAAPSGHASAAGQGGMTDEYARELERQNLALPGDEAPNLGLSSPNNEFTLYEAPPPPPLKTAWGTGVDRGMSGLDAYQGPADYDAYKQYLNEVETHDLAGGPASGDPWGLLAPASKETVYSDAELQALGIGSGAEAGLSAAEIADSVTAAEEGLLAIEAAETADSAWGGPWTFAANQALNLIPTQDKKKTKTPFGEEGSKSGVLKGTGKGALLGGTIGSAFPVIGTGIGAAVGGGVGFIAGSQGYFDSTSAPTITMSSIRRGGGGMQGGLLGGGSMYG